MTDFYCTLTENADIIAFWEMIFTGASALFTLVLTIIIICQTSNLHKKQQKLEKKLNESQIEMQKRQAKLAVYEYRRNVYEKICKIYSLCERVKAVSDYVDLKKASLETVENFYVSKINEYDISYDEIEYCILESKHLLPENIHQKLDYIKDSFTLMITIMTSMKLYRDYIKRSDDEEPQSIVNSCVDNVNTLIEKILNTKDDTFVQLDKLLDVSLLEQ